MEKIPGEKPVIYLDNAATSFPKPAAVAEAMANLINTSALSPGRAAHEFSLAAGRVIYEAREAVAELFHYPDSSRVIFTSNITESLNTGILGLLQPGDHVITTGMEHNSVMRPLRFLEKTKGITVSIMPTSGTGEIDPADLPRLLKRNTRLIVVNHVSNVTGAVAPLAEIGKLKGDAVFMVDTAQSAGVFAIDMEAFGIDFLAFTGHKSLLGPTGTGGFILRQGLAIAPLKLGGTGSNSEKEEQPTLLPDCYEAGTPNTLGIAGLLAGIQFIRQTGLDTIRQHEQALTALFLDGLLAIGGITQYGPVDPSRRGAVVSITMAGKSVSDLAFALGRNFRIMTRAGLHCAPAAHKTIGTFPEGTLRVSFGCFNREQDVHDCLAALAQIRSQAC